MQKNIQSIRGMRDIHSQDAVYWSYLETILKDLSTKYGYDYIKFPILEKTALFKRSIGDTTDIVEKEMYTFEDRNGDSLSMRPEGTAVCVRAGIQHGLLYNQRRKFWYMGPMFRHERPQQGRYRQFEQFGLEVFGVNSVDIEVELILFCSRLWRLLGIDDKLSLNINTIGNIESRELYKKDLVSYFKKNINTLDKDSLHKLETNPLRILDSKNPDLEKIIIQAPNIHDYLDENSKNHFALLTQMLDTLGINYNVQSSLVRGLDYYNDTVFEWVTDSLGAKSEVCAGGRYDKLVSLLGGHECYGVGFAIGMDRLVSLIQLGDFNHNRKADVFIISENDCAIRAKAMQIAEDIRNKYPDRNILIYTGSGNLKKQFKEADKHNANIAVVITDKEFKKESISAKILNADKPQTMYTMQEFDRFLHNNLT
ncbi:MAG: histidine--tRNA ligase [Legionellales bacterium]|nr:histidine--tRNA ligase [Legionellales bacterium]